MRRTSVASIGSAAAAMALVASAAAAYHTRWGERLRLGLRDRVARAALARGFEAVMVDPLVSSHLDPAPQSPSSPLAILLVGADRRGGLTGRVADLADDVRGARADAIALAVCLPSRGEVIVLRIPRDLRVELPGVGWQKLGWALDYGGASLLVSAVRRLTGAQIHHYAELDFQGFVELVDAIGGIRVKLPVAVRDRLSGLDLRRGRQRLDGWSALALARSRHDEVAHRDGVVQVALGDEGRRRRQDVVMAAVLRRVATGLLPVKRLRKCAEAARHITIDDRLRPDHLLEQMSGLGTPQTRTVRLPVDHRRSAEETQSPFPPHQRDSADQTILRQPDATFALERYRSLVRAAAP